MFEEYASFLRKSTPILILLFSSVYSTMQIFIYLPWMVQHLIPGLDEKDIGFYSGLIGFAQFFGRALSSYFWGYIADKIGRKRVLIASGILLTIATLGYGVSVNFEMAITFRFLVGLLNGIVPIARAAISELSNDSTQPFAMGLISAISSLGFVLGCGISGFLADPLSNFDGIDTIWVVRIFTMFPYILPAIANAIFIIIGLLAMLFFTQEHNTCKNVNKVKTISVYFIEDRSLEEWDEVIWPKQENNGLKSIIQYIQKSTLYILITDKVVILTIIIYSVFQAVVTAFEEVLPLWIKLPNDLGGLGMSMNKFSMIASLSACITFIATIFLFQIITSYLNGLRTYYLLTMLLIPFTVCLPMISRIEDQFIVEFCLAITLIIIRLLTTASTTGILMFINNSVTSDKLGTVNGLSIAICSIFRAFAPIYGGTVFAASLNNHVYPIDYNLIFIINGLLFGLCVVLGSALPERINRKRK